MYTATGTARRRTVRLDDLPDDVILLLIPYLSALDLAALSQTCRRLGNLARQGGWNLMKRRSKAVHITVPLGRLTIAQQCIFEDYVRTNWEKRVFRARPSCQRWPQKCIPRLLISQDWILTGVGSELHCAAVLRDEPSHSRLRRIWSNKYLNLGRWQQHKLGRCGLDDITDIQAVPFFQDNSVVIGQANGRLQILNVRNDQNFELQKTHTYDRLLGSMVRGIAVDAKLALLAVTSSSDVRNHALSVFTTQGLSAEIKLRTRPWSVHMQPYVSAIAVGTHGDRPLQLFACTEAEIVPFRTLDVICSPVYSMISSVFQPYMLNAGYFDGYVRLFDLRSPSAKPALSLCDPYDPSAVYCLCQPLEYQFVAGAAINGILRVWDIRCGDSSHKQYEKGGWSTYLGRERSAVYALACESSRVYAATEGTVWALDFGNPPKTPQNQNPYHNYVWRRDSNVIGLSQRLNGYMNHANMLQFGQDPVTSHVSTIYDHSSGL